MSSVFNMGSNFNDFLCGIKKIISFVCKKRSFTLIIHSASKSEKADLK